MFEQASRVEGLVLVLSLSVGASGSQISRFGVAVEPQSLRGVSVSSCGTWAIAESYGYSNLSTSPIQSLQKHEQTAISLS